MNGYPSGWRVGGRSTFEVHFATLSAGRYDFGGFFSNQYSRLSASAT